MMTCRGLSNVCLPYKSAFNLLAISMAGKPYVPDESETRFLYVGETYKLNATHEAWCRTNGVVSNIKRKGKVITKNKVFVLDCIALHNTLEQ